MPIELKPVTLNELPLLQEQLPKLQNGDCNLSIASVIGRAKEYNIKWGISQGELVLNWAPYPDIPPAYVIPLRSENALAIIEDIASECQCCKEPVILFGRFTFMTERISELMRYRNFIMSMNVTRSKTWKAENYTASEISIRDFIRPIRTLSSYPSRRNSLKKQEYF